MTKLYITNRQLDFFKNRIKKELENIKRDIGDLRYNLYVSMVEQSEDYDELREMAELELQIDYIDYVREYIKSKLDEKNVDIKDLRKVCHPSYNNVEEQVVEENDLEVDIESPETLTALALALHRRLDNEPIEERERECILARMVEELDEEAELNSLLVQSEEWDEYIESNLEEDDILINCEDETSLDEECYIDGYDIVEDTKEDIGINEDDTDSCDYIDDENTDEENLEYNIDIDYSIDGDEYFTEEVDCSTLDLDVEELDESEYFSEYDEVCDNTGSNFDIDLEDESELIVEDENEILDAGEDEFDINTDELFVESDYDDGFTSLSSDITIEDNELDTEDEYIDNNFNILDIDGSIEDFDSLYGSSSKPNINYENKVSTRNKTELKKEVSSEVIFENEKTQRMFDSICKTVNITTAFTQKIVDKTVNNISKTSKNVLNNSFFKLDGEENEKNS